MGRFETTSGSTCWGSGLPCRRMVYRRDFVADPWSICGRSVVHPRSILGRVGPRETPPGVDIIEEVVKNSEPRFAFDVEGLRAMIGQGFGFFRPREAGAWVCALGCARFFLLGGRFVASGVGGVIGGRLSAGTARDGRRRPDGTVATGQQDGARAARRARVAFRLRAAGLGLAPGRGRRARVGGGRAAGRVRGWARGRARRRPGRVRRAQRERLAGGASTPGRRGWERIAPWRRARARGARAARAAGGWAGARGDWFMTFEALLMLESNLGCTRTSMVSNVT